MHRIQYIDSWSSLIYKAATFKSYICVCHLIISVSTDLLSLMQLSLDCYIYCETHNLFVYLQMIYPGRILKLRVRGTKRDLIQDTSSEEVCVVMPGVVARCDGSDIQVDDITFRQAIKILEAISSLDRNQDVLYH